MTDLTKAKHIANNPIAYTNNVIKDTMNELIAEVERLTKVDVEPCAYMYPDDYERMTTTETFCTVYSVPCGSPTQGKTTVELVPASALAELRQENERLLAKLVECRSSVKSHINEYDRFMMRKEPHANQCDRDEQIRLHDLLNWIDDNVAMKGDV